MKGSRSKPSSLAAFLLTASFVTACSGGGSSGQGPTEPPPVPTEPYVLQISWEYDVGMGDGPVDGVSSVIAGETLVLYNEEGGYCIQDGTGSEVCYPDIAECRTTTWGMVQAYYHDSLHADGPGREGPLVASGCSLAIIWDYYTRCCLVES